MNLKFVFRSKGSLMSIFLSLVTHIKLVYFLSSIFIMIASNYHHKEVP
jgi:hypothetical protein